MRLKDLDEVKDTLRAMARLEDVLPLYDVPVQRLGESHYKAICPFHDDTDPSLSVNAEKQLYFCHGCKRGGDVFTFVGEMECASFVETLSKLADLLAYDLTPHQRDPTPEEHEIARLCAVNAAVLHTLGYSADWFSSRHLEHPVLKAYAVRFSASVPTAGGNDRRALSLDWAEKWTDAIVIPLRDVSGRVVGFRNRPIGPDIKARMIGPAEKHPIPIPPLYGLYEARRAIRNAGHVIVVEGEVDVWQMVQHGHENVLGMMGSKFGPAEMQYLLDHGIRSVVLMPDGDKAGRALARAVAEAHKNNTLALRIASLADGDPDEVLLRDPIVVESSLVNARYSFEYLIDAVLAGRTFDSITDRVDALTELRSYFSVAAEYERSLAVQEIALRLDMEKEAVDDFFRGSVDDQRAPLVNVRGERAILAGMISDETYVGEALMGLHPDTFSLSRHKRIFEAVSFLYTTRDAVNVHTLCLYLRNRNDEGLARYVESLHDADEPASRSYAMRDVADKAVRRVVQRQARDTALRLGDTANDSLEIIRSMSAALSRAVVGTTRALRPVDEVVREQMHVIMERVRAPALITGLDLGDAWSSVNIALRGLQKKRLLVLAAPTTVGKTAVAGCWAQRFAVDLREPTLYVTFETGEDVLFERMVAKRSGVESDKIATGYMDETEVRRVQDAALEIGASPLVITRAGRELSALIAIIRHDCMTRGLRVVFVDYLQLMHVGGWRDRRDLELGEITSQLLELANEMGITIVALAQINREGTKMGAAKMEHTGDSYRIAQDADAYLILRFKTEEETQADGPALGNRFAFLDKNRGGRRGIGFSVLANESTSDYKEAYHDQHLLPARRAGSRQDDTGTHVGGSPGVATSVNRRHGKKSS